MIVKGESSHVEKRKINSMFTVFTMWTQDVSTEPVGYHSRGLTATCGLRHVPQVPQNTEDAHCVFYLPCWTEYLIRLFCKLVAPESCCLPTPWQVSRPALASMMTEAWHMYILGTWASKHHNFPTHIGLFLSVTMKILIEHLLLPAEREEIYSPLRGVKT